MTSPTKRSRITFVKREEIDGASAKLFDDTAISTANNQPEEHPGPGKAQAMTGSRSKPLTGRRVTRASSQKPSSAHLNPNPEMPLSRAGTISRRSSLIPTLILTESAVDEQIMEAGPSTGSRKRKSPPVDYKANGHKATIEHETSRRPLATKTILSEQGENIPPRRIAARQRAAMRREAELEKDATLEYAEKTIMEHEKILSSLPAPEELQRQEERFARLEEKLELQFKENERLRHENAMLAETIKKAALESSLLIDEICDLKYHFSIPPLRYRRRDDAHGKPFGSWRRKPSSAEHIPAALDTDRAQSNRCHVNRKLPVLTVSLDPSEPENRSSFEEVDAVPEHSSPKRPQEDRSPRSTPQPAGGSSLSFQHTTTSTKREREDLGGVSVLDSPLPKRIRGEGGALHLMVIPEKEGEGASCELLSPVSPAPAVKKDVEQAYIQACIDGGW